MGLPDSIERLRAALRWHRRLIAAGFAGLAVLAGLQFLAQREDQRPVLVTGGELAGGRTIESADIAVVQVPAELVPDGALSDPQEALGRTVALARPRGAVLTASDLVTGGGLVAEGRLALPVALRDSAALGLLDVGDRIDLIGVTPSGTTSVIATGIRVVAAPESSGSALGGSSSVVLVDVDPDQAATISAAGGSSALDFALH